MSEWTEAKDHHVRGVARLPRRLGLADYLTLVTSIDPTRVRRVPLSAISEEGADDDGEFAFVCCPCGERPIVRAELSKCSGCERYYVIEDLGKVYVAYGAMTPPPGRDNRPSP